MPPEKVQSFLASYSLFDQDSVDQENEHKIADYYGILNYLCSIGDVEKMYMPPNMSSSDGIGRNQELFEEKVMRDLGLEAGYKLLELGCGRGRIMANVATKANVSVTGINIDPIQVQLGNDYAKKIGMSDRLQLIKHSFNNLPLPFPDRSFDALYQMQVLTYVEQGNFDPLFQELYRVLQPGSRLSFLDWVRFPKYNQQNSEHKELMDQVKPLLGAVYNPLPEEFVAALERSGFKIISSGVPGIDGLQYPMIEQAARFFFFLEYVLDFLVFFRILPNHLKVLFERLNKGVPAFIKGDKERLWTSVYHIVAQKQ